MLKKLFHKKPVTFKKPQLKEISRNKELGTQMYRRLLEKKIPIDERIDKYVSFLSALDTELVKKGITSSLEKIEGKSIVDIISKDMCLISIDSINEFMSNRLTVKEKEVHEAVIKSILMSDFISANSFISSEFKKFDLQTRISYKEKMDSFYPHLFRIVKEYNRVTANKERTDIIPNAATKIIGRFEQIIIHLD